MKKTLAIETSCDDTSLAIITFDGDRFECEQMLSFSQIELHAPYGGVVPELAYRSHADKIVRMIEEMNINSNEIDFISVTSHPGLPGSLVV
jgi:N6-L-threonylcarbamoyladenine synthase